MAVEAVRLAITKSVQFRGQTEEFSNVYTIQGLDKDSAAARTALIDAAVAAEKPLFGNIVSFVRANIFSYGSVGPNFMYEARNLSGLGTNTGATSMYRECAVYLRCKMPRKFTLLRSSQPYLKKFLHCCAPVIADQTGAVARTFTTPGLGTPLKAYIDWMDSPGSGLLLTNDAGDLPEGDWEVCQHLEHRQFPRGRKEYP